MEERSDFNYGSRSTSLDNFGDNEPPQVTAVVRFSYSTAMTTEGEGIIIENASDGETLHLLSSTTTTNTTTSPSSVSTSSLKSGGWKVSYRVKNLYKTIFTIVSISCLTFIAIIVLLATTTNVLNLNSSSDSTSSSNDEIKFETTTLDKEDTSNLSFLLFRMGYSPLDYFAAGASPILKYKFMSDLKTVIEPNVDMDIQITGFDNYNNYDFEYLVCLDTDIDTCDRGFVYSNSSERMIINIDCEPHTSYTITLSQYDASTSTLLNSFTASAACMYVRREISSLTTSDLAKTLDAMYELWAQSESNGRLLYGDDFHAVSYFIQAHEFNSGQRDSDHMHEGMGFLPQHIKLSNIFEIAMQAVDPSVSLPYWDYTVDRANKLTIFESFMFSPDTFGSIYEPVDEFWGWTWANDNMEDAAIQDGRWAKIKVETNVAFTDLKNSYGTVRGLWSSNPSPYVSRFPNKFPKLPSCTAFYDWLGITTFASFFNTANNDPHASTHGIIASVYGCDAMDDMLEGGYLKDEDTQVELCSQWSFILKDLYRSNYIDMKANCSITSYTMEGINCGFSCNADNYDEMPSFLKTEINSNWIPDDMDEEDGWNAWRDFICEGKGYLVFSGDHLDPSTSANDPSFWPIHPSLERLLHAKYMTGGFSEMEWPTDAYIVCTLDSCYEEDYGATDTFDECCFGHYENDQMMDFTTGDKTLGFGPTNKELLESIDPASESYSVNYIYDSMSWDHCDEDFDSLIQTLYDDLAPTVTSR